VIAHRRDAGRLHRRAQFRGRRTTRDRLADVVVRREELDERHAIEVAAASARVAARPLGSPNPVRVVLAPQPARFEIRMDGSTTGT
jgi:hypothetical protein